MQGEGDRVSTSNLASPPLAGGRGTTKWWKGVAPSGRCLRSGHKNSVKGKGAIKHKGAPAIIYHCTDAPFRLAALATHPLSGGGQETWRRGAINPKPCLPLLAGGGGPRLYLKPCLPPLAGGRGTTSLPQILPPPACGGEGDRVPKNLPPPARGGRGTTKWWKGVAPSGRWLRSGHKNSVKGKGAIKHKGAPTIIYHCTDAPFRIASLATHPLSGVGKKNMDAPFRLAPLATPPKRGWARKTWMPPSVSLRSPSTP